MRYASMCLAFSLGLFLQSALVAQEKTNAPEQQARIDKLINQLGHARYGLRERARSELQNLGAAALPQLKSATKHDDMEISEAARKLVAKIERSMLTQRLLQTKRFDLQLNKATVTEALQELTRQSGKQVQLQGNRTQMDAKRITINLKQTTFWEAFDELCQQAGLVETKITNNGRRNRIEQELLLRGIRNIPQIPNIRPPAVRPPQIDPKKLQDLIKKLRQNQIKPQDLQKEMKKLQNDLRKQIEQQQKQLRQLRKQAIPAPAVLPRRGFQFQIQPQQRGQVKPQPAKAPVKVKAFQQIGKPVPVKAPKKLPIGQAIPIKAAVWQAIAPPQVQVKGQPAVQVWNVVNPYQPVGTNAGQIVVQPGTPNRVPTCYVGAMRIQIVAAVKEKDGLKVTFQITPEPGIDGFTLVGSPTIGKAIDDNSQDLDVVMENDKKGNGIEEQIVGGRRRLIRINNRNQPSQYKVTVQFKNGAKVSSVLQQLTGKLTVQMLAPTQPLVVVDNILKAAGKKLKAKDGKDVNIQSVQDMGNGQYRVQLTKELDGNAGGGRIFIGGNVVIRGNVVINGRRYSSNNNLLPVLRDKNNKQLTLVNQSSGINLTNGRGSQRMTYVFQSRGTQPPQQLTLHGRVNEIVDVPFRFTNVPVK